VGAYRLTAALLTHSLFAQHAQAHPVRDRLRAINVAVLALPVESAWKKVGHQRSETGFVSSVIRTIRQPFIIKIADPDKNYRCSALAVAALRQHPENQ